MNKMSEQDHYYKIALIGGAGMCITLFMGFVGFSTFDLPWKTQGFDPGPIIYFIIISIIFAFSFIITVYNLRKSFQHNINQPNIQPENQQDILV